MKFKDRGRKLCKRFVGFIFGEVCVVYFGREPNNFTSFYMGTFHKGWVRIREKKRQQNQNFMVNCTTFRFSTICKTDRYSTPKFSKVGVPIPIWLQLDDFCLCLSVCLQRDNYGTFNPVLVKFWWLLTCQAYIIFGELCRWEFGFILNWAWNKRIIFWNWEKCYFFFFWKHLNLKCKMSRFVILFYTRSVRFIYLKQTSTVPQTEFYRSRNYTYYSIGM